MPYANNASYLYIFIYVYIYIYEYIYICTYICTYIILYISCMCAYKHISILEAQPGATWQQLRGTLGSDGALGSPQGGAPLVINGINMGIPKVIGDFRDFMVIRLSHLVY